MKKYIKMSQDTNGVWQYDDPQENDMVFELEAISGRELTSYDVLLNDAPQWAGHEKLHAHLVSLRTDLAYKFKRYFDDTEALEMAVQAYWLALQTTRMQITGTVLEAAKNKHSDSQAKRRIGTGKLTTAQRDRIRRTYKEKCDSGEKYGAIKALAGRYNVSETAIKNIVLNK